MPDIREYRIKTAFDIGSIAHLAPFAKTVGSMAALHIGANVALKPFIRGKFGGGRVQQFLAEKGFSHGYYENKKLHPLVKDTIKQLISPELMQTYDVSNKAGLAARALPKNDVTNFLTSKFPTVSSDAINPILNNVGKGIQRSIHNPPQQNHTGFLGKAHDYISSKIKIDPSTEDKLRSSKGFAVARAGINAGSGLAALHGIPVLGDHIAVNTARTMLSRTKAGLKSSKNRLEQGFNGAPESKLKRGLIDYAISPGYGELRDIGASTHKTVSKGVTKLKNLRLTNSVSDIDS